MPTLNISDKVFATMLDEYVDDDLYGAISTFATILAKHAPSCTPVELDESMQELIDVVSASLEKSDSEKLSADTALDLLKSGYVVCGSDIFNRYHICKFEKAPFDSDIGHMAGHLYPRELSLLTTTCLKPVSKNSWIYDAEFKPEPTRRRRAEQNTEK